MASVFGSGKAQCQGDECRATTDVTYRVEERKTLCEKCATKTGCVMKERKGGLKLFCDKHNEPIRIHCKTHDESICILCATINHVQPSCERQDLDDAIAEKKQQLLDLQSTAIDRRTMWGNHGEKIRRCEDDAFEYLKKLQDQIDSLIDDEMKKVKDSARRHKVLITQEAYDEIRRINENRDKRLKECNKNAENQLKPIEDKRCFLHNEITMILDVTMKYVNTLQEQARDVMESMNTTAQRIESLLEDDKKLANGARDVISSLTERLEKTVDEGVVEHITRTVRGVRFIEGVGCEKYNGRIGGFDGKWELTERIRIPDGLVDPHIAGCIGDANVIMTEDFKKKLALFYSTGHSYNLSILDKTTKMVITDDSPSGFSSCGLLNEDTVVCGMYKLLSQCGDNLDDAIRLYNREWNLIKSISIPYNNNWIDPGVDVCVDKDGLIIAAERRQNKIYVINPDDGGIFQTITCRADIMLCGTLSSGDVIAIPFPNNDKILIISRNGAHKEIFVGGVVYYCAVDPQTDDIYPVYKTKGQNTFFVNHVCGTGEEKAKIILQYNPYESTDVARRSRLAITPLGRLVLCDDKDCLVYQKTFCFFKEDNV